MTFGKATVCLGAIALLSACTVQSGGMDITSGDTPRATELAANLHSFGESEGQPILVFHMAGSNTRGEYANIAVRLIAAGYQVFGADLSAGGERFGYTSLVGADGSRQEYCADFPAMITAIEAIAAHTGKRPILLGSSYSAALVMRAAVEYPEKVAGFVSFSPAAGAGLSECAPSELLDQLVVPGMGVRPRSEIEGPPSVAAQAAEWRARGVPVEVTEVRSHGASMLDSSRAGEEAEAFWPILLEFLDRASTEKR